MSPPVLKPPPPPEPKPLYNVAKRPPETIETGGYPEGLHIRIERGPSNSMDKIGIGQAWNWVIYFNDLELGYSNAWYPSKDFAASVAKLFFKSNIPIYG